MGFFDLFGKKIVMVVFNEVLFGRLVIMFVLDKYFVNGNFFKVFFF